MVIAQVKLSPGNVGWYDVLTNTHLTIAKPFADIHAGMNTSNIEKALRYKTLVLVSGSLEKEAIIEQVEKAKEAVAAQEITAEPQTKETEIATVAEEKVEEKAEEKVVASKSKKRSKTKDK